VLCSFYLVGCSTPALNSSIPATHLPPLAAGWDSGGTGAIVGAVTDLGGKRLYRAAVVVQSLQADAHYLPGRPPYVYTDSTGWMLFDRLAPGTYAVTARLLGYRMCSVNVLVRSERADTVFMVLDAMSIVFNDAPGYEPPPSGPVGYCQGRSWSRRVP